MAGRLHQRQQVVSRLCGTACAWWPGGSGELALELFDHRQVHLGDGQVVLREADHSPGRAVTDFLAGPADALLVTGDLNVVPSQIELVTRRCFSSRACSCCKALGAVGSVACSLLARTFKLARTVSCPA